MPLTDRRAIGLSKVRVFMGSAGEGVTEGSGDLGGQRGEDSGLGGVHVAGLVVDDGEGGLEGDGGFGVGAETDNDFDRLEAGSRRVVDDFGERGAELEHAGNDGFFGLVRFHALTVSAYRLRVQKILSLIRERY